MRWEIDSGDDVIVLRPVRPEHEIGWWLTSMDGWDGTPAMREDSVARIGMDGAYPPANPTQGPRTLTLGGAAGCSSSVEAGLLAERVTGLFGRPLKVSRIDTMSVKWVTGLLSDDPKPVVHPSQRELSFTLVVHCDDPHKYGPPAWFTPVNGRVTVENQGTAPTWPVLHADNPDGLTFVNVSDGNGHEIAWQGDGSMTGVDLDFAELDPGTGVVMQDSAIPVPHGSTLLYVTATRGTSVSVECCPAWR